MRANQTLVTLDISGVPGTGKTATVHTVIRELKRMAEESVCFLTPEVYYPF